MPEAWVALMAIHLLKLFPPSVTYLTKNDEDPNGIKLGRTHEWFHGISCGLL
jgi:hypothetical protein